MRTPTIQVQRWSNMCICKTCLHHKVIQEVLLDAGNGWSATDRLRKWRRRTGLNRSTKTVPLSLNGVHVCVHTSIRTYAYPQRSKYMQHCMPHVQIGSQADVQKKIGASLTARPRKRWCQNRISKTTFSKMPSPFVSILYTMQPRRKATVDLRP